MSDILKHIPVGYIANQVAHQMGLAEGIPGLRSTTTLGDIMEQYQQAKLSANYIRGKIGEKKNKVRDRVDRRLAREFEKNKTQSSSTSRTYSPTGSYNPSPLPKQYQGGASDFNRLADQQAKQSSQYLADQQNDDDPASFNQNKAKRDLNSAKKEATDKFKKEAQELLMKTAEKIAKKLGLRTVSLSSGSTGVGLIVTFIIWSGQAILGNLMGSKIVPKLDWWEFILWLVVGLALLGILILASALLVLISDPVGVGWDALSNWISS